MLEKIHRFSFMGAEMTFVPSYDPCYQARSFDGGSPLFSSFIFLISFFPVMISDLRTRFVTMGQ